MRRWRRALAEPAIAVASPVAVLAAWEWASATGRLREAFFPRPSTVLVHLYRLGADGTLAHHAAATLARVAWAFALAAVLGVAVGLGMGLWRRLHAGLDPVFAVIYPIPSVLFLPLVSFVAPRGEVANVVTIAVTSFFLVAFTTMHGVRQLDRLVVDAAVHYGARGWRLFAGVLLPGALPFILTGLRLGLGYTLIVAIAVEIVAAGRGLGSVLWLSWQVLKVEDMYAVFVVIAALGAGLSYGLAALRGRLLPWAQDAAER
ncbi:MAG TPA: ABC transporter permease [Methylomirabilota bacterium]|nr:ABC transporter permease [Methylomirabilota bacterium]